MILSQHDSPQMMRQALNAGARGYVVKTAIAQDLLTGIDKVRSGRLFFPDSVTGSADANVDMQEILQRSQAFEKALRESEERYRLTFEQAAVGIAHVSKDGHYLRVNQKLCRNRGPHAGRFAEAHDEPDLLSGRISKPISSKPAKLSQANSISTPPKSA